MNNKLINKDFTIRILSVMLALLMWFYVITEQNPEITKDVTIPIRLINTVSLEKNNMVLAGDPDSFELTLRIKGKKDLLDKLNAGTINAYADLAGHNLKGENFLKINISGIPEDVNILMKSADSLKVLLEPKVSVQKSVQLNIMGNPTHGMAAMTPALAPSDVVITGAESQINKVQNVRVDVDIASVNAEVKKILPVRVLDKEGKDIKNITVEPSNITVSIPIEDTKRVSLNMDILGQPAAGYVVSNISAQPEELLITGKQQALEGIDLLKTEKIDITGEKNDISREVKLIIPEGIEIVNANEKVNLYLKIEKIVTNEITIKDLEYVNLADNLELESMQSDIKVSLRGAESLVAEAPRTIKYYVDLKDAAEGHNALDVLWEAPKGIEILDVSPKQAVVVLKKKVEQPGDD
ncbi:MAG: CdaR family protein [Clostridiaceae bacterium]|nr:CdaR family protein [Clostridiaceae bacterium]